MPKGIRQIGEERVRALLRSATLRKIAWLGFGGVIMPALATGVVGVLVLVLSPGGAGLALGVLAIVFAVFTAAGSVVTLMLMRRAQRAALTQIEFLGRISHAIRTPLAAVRMHADTLRMGRFRSREEEEACIEALSRDLARLSELLEQLLSFRDSRDGGASGTAEVLDPAEVVRDVLAELVPVEGERVSVRLEHGGALVRTDPEGLAESLGQLIENALTHGAPPVTVVVTASDGWVVVSVEDCGPGVRSRERRRILQPFYRGKTSRGPGLGLGLALVQSFAEANGGKVTVENRPEGGAVFSVWLPRWEERREVEGRAASD